MPTLRRHRRAAIVFAAVVACGSAVAISQYSPTRASSRAQSDIVPLSQAALPKVFRDGITASAANVGASTQTLRQISSANVPDRRSGIVLGRNTGGDVVALVTPQTFTSFQPPALVLKNAGSPVVVFSAAQPAPDGTTGHVQIEGWATGDVAHVKLSLRDGSSIDAELVRAGVDGFAYFTYASDTPATFPLEMQATDASGQVVGSHDFSVETAPPKLSS